MIGRGRGAVGDGGGEGANGTRRHGDVATRRSGFRGGWKLCRVVRNWATLCMSVSLGVFGRSKPISYKGFVFIVLCAIHHVPDQVGGVLEEQPSRRIVAAV